MTHFDDESLFEYVEGTSPVAGEIESHVSSCGDCAEEVGEQPARRSAGHEEGPIMAWAGRRCPSGDGRTACQRTRHGVLPRCLPGPSTGDPSEEPRRGERPQGGRPRQPRRNR